MMNTKEDALQFISKNDVKFIRLAFCDVHGVQKNISVMPSELAGVFEKGIPFDAYSIDGFADSDKSSLFLFPDPTTLTFLPWRPSHGRVVRFFCDIRKKDGSVFEGDFRYLLRRAVQRIEALDFDCKIGTKSEFYLFRADEHGSPTLEPFDEAGYLDVAPLDKGENIRREICLTLEEMGIQPESSCHKRGPGQDEIDFKFGPAVTAADNLITYKSVVKTMAARNGLYASFMPKPIADKSGSGLHLNISLYRGGKNVFECAPEIAESFIEGILSKIGEITVFLNPLTNSYARFGCFEAPKYIAWSKDRAQLIRLLGMRPENMRMELRSPDPACNPYIAMALILNAGAEGIEKRLAARPAIDLDLSSTPLNILEKLDSLPNSLSEAVELGQNSNFVRSIIPQHALQHYMDQKRNEYMAYLQADNRERFEMDLYFKNI